MILGHTPAKHILTTLFDQAAAKGLPHFVILEGPEHTGKTSLVLEYLQNFLGEWGRQDLLHIKDFSDELGKDHTIRIEENTTTESFDTLMKEQRYRDIGVREMSEWLQKSATNNRKILLVENSERMSREAMNAFLKTAEEPLPKRAIFATCSHPQQLLDTIHSRALIIKTQALTDSEMEQYVSTANLSFSSPELKAMTLAMAMGRPGILTKLTTKTDEESPHIDAIEYLARELPKPGNLYTKQQKLIALDKQQLLIPFLEGRIAYASQHNLVDQAQSRFKVKELLETNVNKEHLILYGLVGIGKK